ncbi:hypothetical protein M413DRAFT_442669 [Hebeloma cylindrosporum]|uniref:Uncharacterized protein n=1 Tax=Hebeloma cylindrosporum TaxID=76867 RepID=A0A0C2Y4E5_HEBCY|nr:hypothetical protein M413DRAFT_442669 [Hebeloma cylindrosporum h7]
MKQRQYSGSSKTPMSTVHRESGLSSRHANHHASCIRPADIRQDEIIVLKSEQSRAFLSSSPHDHGFDSVSLREACFVSAAALDLIMCGVPMGNK